MNTTTAAAKAHRTTATIRAWCRYGAISATKHAGRWIIDETSLDYRISLDTPKPKPVVYSVETMTAIGGNRWQKAGMDRIYLDWREFAGLETTHYNTGNISSASYQGEGISNSQAYKIASSVEKVWYDTADGKLHCRYGFGNPRIGREQVWADIISGVRTAIAAL